MPKTRKAEATPTPDAAHETTPAITLADERAPAKEAIQESRQPEREGAAGEPAYAPDPHSKISVSLSDVRGGPAMHLLRSQRFRQMQIQFDREQPGEQYLAMLKRAGWRDRTEEEGVWTKQIDPNARWQSVQQMEHEFRDVANAIRKGKRLRPVLEGLGA
jgi:hypothetical protein